MEFRNKHKHKYTNKNTNPVSGSPGDSKIESRGDPETPKSSLRITRRLQM